MTAIMMVTNATMLGISFDDVYIHHRALGVLFCHILTWLSCLFKDVNECLEGEYCFPKGECVNTEGSYRCVCSQGYTTSSDGSSCLGEASRPSHTHTHLMHIPKSDWPFCRLLLNLQNGEVSTHYIYLLFTLFKLHSPLTWTTLIPYTNNPL